MTEGENAARGSERFFAGVYRRIAWQMAALTALATPVLGVALGWRFAAGFAGGALTASTNFYLLKAGAAGLADVVTRTGHRSSAMIVAKFLLRFGLLALIVYGIFQSSGQVVYGFLAGLFVPVAALGCEAAYEAWSTLRHDI